MEDELIKVKISIGLTSFDPLKMDIDKHHITIMADKALIKAKNSGKNQTFVI
jgi:PleD family two-component response regulator